MRQRGHERLLPEFRFDGREGELWVDVLDRDERFVNGLAMSAAVVRPGEDPAGLALEQVAPGRYRGKFEVAGPGSFYVTLSGAREGLQVGPRTFGVSVPYSAEYLEQGPDPALLEAVAAATGGRVLPLAASSLPAILAPKPDAAAQRFRVWWPWVLAALVLVVLEVAVRKVVWPRRGSAVEGAAGEAGAEAASEVVPLAARARREAVDRVRLHVAAGGGRRGR